MHRIFYILFILCSLSCAKVNHLAEVKTEQYRMETVSSASDAEIEALIQPYKVQLDAEMNTVIGHCEVKLTKTKPESTLGNWMADLLQSESERHYAGAIDFSIVNYGGIRLTSLPIGPLTRGKVFELMPFDNKVVVLKVKGNIVQQLFERMADYGGWPISAGVEYQIEAGLPKNIKINREALDLERTYKIALSDFVANGGDKCFFFRDQPREELNIVYRDMIIDHIKTQTKQGKKITAQITGRVVVK